jgi:colanic acid biosynthesis glycosyl transferase WcaI
MRRVPWVLWLHDLLPDGAAATGLVNNDGTVINLARKLERAAYRAADRIVVLSSAFTGNLVAKGVPETKLELIYDPATRIPRRLAAPASQPGRMQLLSMGNIGHSQGLAALVGAFERAPQLAPEATLVITGTGVAAPDARAEIISGRTRMPGLVDEATLETELQGADVGFVSQRYDGSEFNIPSKVMNYMAYGLPVLAAVNPGGEVARIVERSGGGWVVDSSDPDAFPRQVAYLSAHSAEVRERGERALAYAAEHFTQAGFAARFEQTLQAVTTR